MRAGANREKAMIEMRWVPLDQDRIATQGDRDAFDHAVRRGPFNDIGPLILQYREDEGEWQTVEVTE